MVFYANGRTSFVLFLCLPFIRWFHACVLWLYSRFKRERKGGDGHSAMMMMVAKAPHCCTSSRLRRRRGGWCVARVEVWCVYIQYVFRMI